MVMVSHLVYFCHWGRYPSSIYVSASLVLPVRGALQWGQISSGISPGSQISLVQALEHCLQVSLPQGATILPGFRELS
jgi:hypothetical protein